MSLADMLSTWGLALPSRRWLRRLDVVSMLLSVYFDQPETVSPRALVDGHELMETLELSPGPKIGRLLEAIREAQAIGEVTNREQALALAQRLQSEA
jgi:hypothetical protein